MLLELGPQKETRPLGEPSKDDQSFNKRQVSASELREQLRQQELMTSTERNAASWLETWSKGMKPQQEKVKSKPRTKQAPKIAALPERSPMPADAVQQLQMLYKMANDATSSLSSTTTTTSSSTTTEAPAVNVNESLRLSAPSGFKLPPPALTQDTNFLGISRAKKSSTEITKDLMNVSLEA